MSGQYGAILFWLDSLFHLFYQSLKKQLHSEQQVKQFSSFYLSFIFLMCFLRF